MFAKPTARQIRQAEALFAEDSRARQRAETPQAACEAKQLRAAVAAWLNKLTPREERIIRMRWGFATGEKMTYEEIAQAFSITRERARQIDMKAIRKLKHPAYLDIVVRACCKRDRTIAEQVRGRVVLTEIFRLDAEVLELL